MGLFTTNAPFDAEVEKATDEKDVGEDWTKIMDICDRVNSSSQNAKDCLTSIMNRLRHQDPHVALKSITLLDACVNNCGKPFHLLIASRDFENEFRKILVKAHGDVKMKMLSSLRAWAESEFKTDPQLSLIPSLVAKLKHEGFTFPTANEQIRTAKPKEADDKRREDDDLAKAIELSLKESSSPKNKASTSTATSLYPSTSLLTTQSPPEGRKVRALYDFEAVEDNELTFSAGEIVVIIDDSDPNWWKGSSKRGEGLFPSNFVTADLSYEAETQKFEPKKSVQFDDEVSVKKITKEPAEIEIDESKMDKLLHYLHEADPTNASGDPFEMEELAEEVNAMGPLIDAELERVDGKHAQLTQLSLDLVDALNLYHTLMREPTQVPPPPQQQPTQRPPVSTYGGAVQKPPTSMPYGYMPPPPMQMNGAAGPPSMPPYNLGHMMPPPPQGPMAPMVPPPRPPATMPPLGPHGTSIPPMGPPHPVMMPPGAMPHYMQQDPSRQLINGHFAYGPPMAMTSTFEMSGTSMPPQNTNFQEKPPMQ